MKFVVKAPVALEDGVYQGIIKRIEYREEPFHYTDIYVMPDGKEFEIKYGCPSGISQNTKLGKLLSLFLGQDLRVGEELDPEVVLLNKQCKFMVQNEKAKDGNEYARIVADSLKPAKKIESAEKKKE